MTFTWYIMFTTKTCTENPKGFIFTIHWDLSKVMMTHWLKQNKKEA